MSVFLSGFMSIFNRVVVAGFAIFAMLFGSGNIAFPPILGKNFGTAWSMANLGWLLAAVIIPMLGYFGSMLFDAKTEKYMKPLGKHVTALFMLLVMLLVGPFGVSARCVNVAFGGISIAMPGCPALLFNVIFCIIATILAWDPGKLVQLMGTIFTPLKFGGVAIVILVAIFMSNSEIPVTNFATSKAFLDGFEMGYQTMDLIAAFFMTAPIYLYIKNAIPEKERGGKKSLLKFTGMACAVGGILLALVYTGLAYIGAKYSSLLSGTSDEALFAKIADISMGNCATIFVAVVIAVGCLGTNVAITAMFTDYIHKTILKEKFNRNAILLITGVCTLGMSLLGFAKICSLMAMILSKLYPALIVFVVLRTAYYFMPKKDVA